METTTYDSSKQNTTNPMNTPTTQSPQPQTISVSMKPSQFIDTYAAQMQRNAGYGSNEYWQIAAIKLFLDSQTK